LAGKNALSSGVKWLADEARYSALSSIDRDENMSARFVTASTRMFSKLPLSSGFDTKALYAIFPAHLSLLDLTAQITDENYVS
jgi:hypothetical protein